MATSNYSWPAASLRKFIGKEIPRIDGPEKVHGQASYTCDYSAPGMLYARVVRCPYAHAKITSIDTSLAEKTAGFSAAYIVQPVGTEIFWAGDDIVAVAAVSEHAAEMASLAVNVKYQVLPHLVLDANTDVPSAFSKPMDPEVVGNPTTAFATAAVVSEGDYGMPVIIHSCMETHGSVVTWTDASMDIQISTQAVSTIPTQFSQALQFPQNKIQATSGYIGGGYGSKLSADRWGLAAAQLSKLCGGVPVKLTIERHAEQEVAGCRPSTYAHIKLGAAADGTVVAWQSVSWSTGGVAGGSEPPLPYLFSSIPNQSRQHTQIVNNIGPARSMRAPHNPQACLLTLGALDDLAATLKMDPVQLLLKNLALIPGGGAVYADMLKVADGLMGWTKRWQQRGSSTGVMRQGLGVSIHSWPGKAHPFQCDLTINPDGSVVIRAGTQDIGTGTRTVMAIVAAETLGLTLDAIQIVIGDSTLPVSAGAGGSGSVGGSGSAVRRASVDALAQLFAKLATILGTTPNNFAAANGMVTVAGGAPLTWKEACGKMGPLPLTVRGVNPGVGSLADVGACGVEMADVSVDTGTGVVRINKIVAVQDCGLIIDLKTATSQAYGAMIMGIGYSLYEEKVMDQNLGRMLNANIEFYRLCGIGDIGELVVHYMTGGSYDARGIVGGGEPAVISPGAAISNAVANALGVRVPYLPLTPDRVLAALGKVPA